MWYLIFKLLCGHAIADFPLQGEFIAKFKSRWTPSQETIWPYVLGAHSLIHGLMIIVMAGNPYCALFETFAHALIDFGKCERWYGIHADQWLHISCKLLWAYLIAWRVV